MCPHFKRSTEGGRAFAVRVTKEWNKLSVDIKQITSVKSLSLLQNNFRESNSQQIIPVNCSFLTIFYDVYMFLFSLSIFLYCYFFEGH